MTNRQQDTDIVIKDELTQAEEVLLIVVVLADKKIPVTLENAQEQLADALATRPELWTLTADRLAELWPLAEHCPFCQSPLPPTEGYRTCPACGAKEDEPGCCDEPFFFKDDPDQGMVHYACLCGREQASDSYDDLHGPMSVPWGGV